MDQVVLTVVALMAASFNTSSLPDRSGNNWPHKANHGPVRNVHGVCRIAIDKKKVGLDQVEELVCYPSGHPELGMHRLLDWINEDQASGSSLSREGSAFLLTTWRRMDTGQANTTNITFDFADHRLVVETVDWDGLTEQKSGNRHYVKYVTNFLEGYSAKFNLDCKSPYLIYRKNSKKGRIPLPMVVYRLVEDIGRLDTMDDGKDYTCPEDKPIDKRR